METIVITISGSENYALNTGYGMVHKRTQATKVANNDNCFGEQVCGLVPMLKNSTCKKNDCMTLKVFNTDKNSFFFDSFESLPFRMEKFNNGVWQNLGNFSTAFGTLYTFGSIAVSTWSGVTIDWQLVYNLHGKGNYRFVIGLQNSSCFQYSYTFALDLFSCEKAQETCYIESVIRSRVIGDIDNPKKEINTNLFTINDSCRYPAKLLQRIADYEKTTYFEPISSIVSNEVLHSSRLRRKYDLNVYNLTTALYERLVHYGLIDCSITDFNDNSNVKQKVRVQLDSANEVNYDNLAFIPNSISETITLVDYNDNLLIRTT